jgi:hypothetical protein
MQILAVSIVALSIRRKDTCQRDLNAERRTVEQILRIGKKTGVGEQGYSVHTRTSRYLSCEPLMKARAYRVHYQKALKGHTAFFERQAIAQPERRPEYPR